MNDRDPEPLQSGNAEISSLRELADRLDTVRGKKTVAHCHGVFDVLHVGHIRHLREASELGDLLVVTITPDEHVDKGPDRPAFPEELRAEVVASMDCVDHVAINEWATAVETLKKLRPDYYVKGPDYKDKEADVTGGIYAEQEAAEEVGAELYITEDITFSSSNIINEYLPHFPEHVRDYLAEFKGERSREEVLAYLDSAEDLSVLVVGEAIVDEYVYCEDMGKSSKDPVLATRYRSRERFAGGALALANHLSGFCDDVGLLTFLGPDEDDETFVRDALDDKVDPDLLRHEDAPTIVKRRFVEDYLMQKLFEVYVMDEHGISDGERAAFQDRLRDRIPDHDIVITVDYGHGMIDETAVDILTREAPFLAVNTQVNAGNRGFHTVSKYPEADYVSLATKELAMELGEPPDDVPRMMRQLRKRIDVDRITVTTGKRGNVVYHEGEGFHETPAFAPNTVDRIGAGDAVLAITSLLEAQGAPNDIVGFVGNAVGAEAVQIVGNRQPIEPVSLKKHIETLMK